MLKAFTETNIKEKKREQKESNINNYFEETKLTILLIKNTNKIMENKIEKKTQILLFLLVNCLKKT